MSMPLLRRLATHFFTALLLLATATRVMAANPIIDATGVKEAITRGAIIWDVRAAPAYQKAHIPGAISIGDAGNALRNPVTEDFIDSAQIEKIFGEAGLDPAKEIIVYGDRGAALAYFGRFALRYFGAAQVSVFHDGIDGWQAEGGTTTAIENRLPAAKIKLVAKPELAVTTEEVIARTKDGKAQILDVRTTGEYDGADVRAIRGGHIPDAISIPYEKNWKDPDTQGKLARRQVTDNSGASLAPTEQLKSLYAKLDPAKETVVYCQSGVRASETAAVLESLGFRDVKVYDSSWLGYAARLDAPAAKETFFNVGALNGKLAAMQKRIELLEQNLTQLQAARPGAQ